jgi:hypothetical protein
MEQYNTLLIFGYGQTQLITNTDSILVDSCTLTSLNSVIENIYFNKPTDNKSQDHYTRIAIYNYDFTDWINNTPNDYFKVPYYKLDQSKIENLINEIILLKK